MAAKSSSSSSSSCRTLLAPGCVGGKWAVSRLVVVVGDMLLCRAVLCHAVHRCNPTAISLKAGCELFLRYTTRTSALELEDFSAAKKRLIEVRGGC
jgi:hypothetical protein